MRPFILNFALPRNGEYKPIYSYSFADSMNVVKIRGSEINFIEIDSGELEFRTKTKVKAESDDEGLNLLEVKTKTEVTPEKDDDPKHFLEMQTKTFVKQERDD